MNTYLFEGEQRSVSQIHAMVPAIGLTTLREWARTGRMPATKQEALSRPKHKRRKVTAEQKRHIYGLMRPSKPKDKL